MTGLKTYWQLFCSFLKIGSFTFGGGYAMVPLIQEEVSRKRGWIAEEEFLELLTLAQSAPGPIALNTSVFVGYKIKGFWGSVAAIMGVVVPCYVIILIIAIYFTDIRNNHYVDSAFKGMRPAVIALIAAPIFGLAKGMGVVSWIIAVTAALAVWQLGVTPILFIVLGAVGGILFHVWKNRKKIEK